MTKTDMIKILTEAKLLYGNHDLSEPEVEAWFNWFGMHSRDAFRAALMAAAKGEKYFPTPGIVQSQIERLEPRSELKVTALEALANPSGPLSSEASQFADRVTPDISRTQFESPEELDKAIRINQAQWRKNFQARFEQLQDRALALVRIGVSHDAATRQVLELASSIALPVSELVSAATSKMIEAR